MHLAVGLVIVLPFLVFAPAHALAAWTHPNRRAARIGYVLAALAVGRAGQGRGADARRRVRAAATRHAGARLLGARAGPARRRLGVRQPSPARTSAERRARPGRGRPATAALVALTAAIDVRTSRPPSSPTATVSFAPSFVAHRQRRADPGRGADGGRLLRRVPHRRASRLAVERAPLQLVQQQGLRRQREGDAPGDAGPRRQRRGQPLVRRLPRSRCRSSAAPSTAPTSTPKAIPTSQAGLTCTACHAIEQVNSTRGNGDYTIGEPRHYPFAFSASPALRELSKQLIKAKPAFHKRDVPQADAPHGRVLLDLPQGAHPGRAQRLQGVPARAEPLRQLHPERRVGPRRAQLLLSAEGRGALRRLPHAAARLARLRRAGLRRQRRPPDPRSPLLAANTGVAAPARRPDTVRGAPGVPRQGGRRSTSSACARAARCRGASSDRSAPTRPLCGPASATWWRSSCARARSAITSPRARPIPTRSGWS